MNKQEYKLLSEEIMTLTANEQFQDAAGIADRIDWRKVRSFSMLMKISELYQLNRRYDDALEIMLMAYDHNPKNRDIVYSLCELYIILGNHVKALEFLALYKRMAPHDPGVYILQYKFQELEGASIEDQIQLLEEFTRKDYREEWVYQLAYLYHRMGLGTKCVETCDDLLNWFKEGPFVIKTLELKMLHARLKPEQQAIYDRREDIADEIEAVESDEYTAEKADPDLHPEMSDVDFHVKTIDMSKFNTINLQKTLAESMRELMGVENASGSDTRSGGRDMKPMMEDDYMSTGELERQMAYAGSEHYPEENSEGYEEEYPEESYEGDYSGETYEEAYPEEGYEGDYPEDSYGDGEYYPEDGYAEGYSEEGYEEEPAAEEYTDGGNGNGYSEGYGEAEPDPFESVPGELASELEGVEDQTIYFRPEEIPPAVNTVNSVNKEKRGKVFNTGSINTGDDEIFFEDRTDDIVIDNLPSNTNPAYESVLSKAREVMLEEERERAQRSQYMGNDVERRTVRSGRPAMDGMFYLGDDGQLGLAVPASSPVEKQITGQIHINDYLSEWEKTKRRKLAQQDEELHRSILERTGPIYKDYEEKSRNGLIQELEREQKIFADKYQADDIELRTIEEISEDPAAAEGVSDGVLADEPAAGEVDIMGEAVSGRSIWDEVNEAVEADKKSTTGLVDAAVAGAGELADTKDYGIMREITATAVMASDEIEEKIEGSAKDESEKEQPADNSNPEEQPENT